VATAGTVTVDFDARSAKFAAELEKVQSSLRKLEGSTAVVSKAFQALPGILSAGTIIAYGKAMFEAADAIGDAAARSGIAAESLSRLKFAAEQSDVEFGALTTGIKAFQRNLSEATSGSDTASRSFLAIGLEASKIRNLRLEDQLATIADGFKRLSSPADKTRVAMELFGKAGNELIPFLDQGSAGIQKLTAEADRLGITLNNQTVAAVSAADQALKKLKATVNSFFQRALGDIALAIVGIDGLSEIDQLTVKVKRLADEKQRIELSGAPAGSGFAARLKEINAELAIMQPKLQNLQTAASLTLPASEPGQGRAGGGGGANAQGGVGGLFKPPSKEELDRLGGVSLGPLFSPEQLAEQQQIIADQTSLARQQDWQEFLQYEFLKRDAVDETYKAQLAMAQVASETEIQMRQATVNAALGFLNTLAVRSKAAAIAAVLLSRGLAIAQAVQNTAVAVTKALAVDPTGALASRVALLGKIQIGIIAATGALEVANITSGNAGGIGGTSLGTPSNPLPTTSADAQGATPNRSITVVFNGPVTEREALLGIIQDAFDADVVVIPGNSRQAQEIRGG